jgi:hypothetical protein
MKDGRPFTFAELWLGKRMTFRAGPKTRSIKPKLAKRDYSKVHLKYFAKLHTATALGWMGAMAFLLRRLISEADSRTYRKDTNPAQIQPGIQSADLLLKRSQDLSFWAR